MTAKKLEKLPASQVTWDLVGPTVDDDVRRLIWRHGADAVNFRDPENPVLAELYEVQPGFTDPASLHEAIKSALDKLPPPAPKPQKAKTPVLDMADTLENEAIVEAMLAKLEARQPWAFPPVITECQPGSGTAHEAQISLLPNGSLYWILRPSAPALEPFARRLNGLQSL